MRARLFWQAVGRHGYPSLVRGKIVDKLCNLTNTVSVLMLGARWADY